MTNNELIASQFVYQLADERLHIKDVHTQETRCQLNASDSWLLLDFLYQHRDELYRLIHRDEAGKMLTPGDSIALRADLERLPGSAYYDRAYDVYYGVRNGIVASVGR